MTAHYWVWAWRRYTTHMFRRHLNLPPDRCCMSTLMGRPLHAADDGWQFGGHCPKCSPQEDA